MAKKYAQPADVLLGMAVGLLGGFDVMVFVARQTPKVAAWLCRLLSL